MKWLTKNIGIKLEREWKIYELLNGIVIMLYIYIAVWLLTFSNKEL